MTSEGLGEMFEGDSADMCAGKFPLMSMGGQAEGLACTDLGARTPISVSGNSICKLPNNLTAKGEPTLAVLIISLLVVSPDKV